MSNLLAAVSNLLDVQLTNPDLEIIFFEEFLKKLDDYFKGNGKIAYMVYIQNGKARHLPIFFIDRNLIKDVEDTLKRLESKKVIAYDENLKLGNKNVVRIYFPFTDLKAFKPNDMNELEKYDRDLPKHSHIASLIKLLWESKDDEALEYLKLTVLPYFEKIAYLGKDYMELLKKIKEKIKKANELLDKMENSIRYKDIKDLYITLMDELNKELDKRPGIVRDRGMLLLITLLAELFDMLARDAGKKKGNPLANLKNAIDIIKEIRRDHKDFFEIFKEWLLRIIRELAKIGKVEIPLYYLLKKLAEYITQNVGTLKILAEGLKRYTDHLNKELAKNPDVDRLRALAKGAISLLTNQLTHIESIKSIMEEDLQSLRDAGQKRAARELEDRIREISETVALLQDVDVKKSNINRIKDDMRLKQIIYYSIYVLTNIYRFYEDLVEGMT